MGMRAILVINSKTGFTQKYGDIISKKLTLPLYFFERTY